MSDLMRHYEQLAAEEDRARRDSYKGEHSLNSLGGFVLPTFSRVTASVGGNGAPDLELVQALELLPEKLRPRAEEQFERGRAKCESPIEERIFPWLLCQQYSCFEQWPSVLLAGETEQLKPYTIAVVPQLKIGNRRADFALAAKRGGPVRFVIVECDGKDFHADVHKDVDRDAELLRYNRVLDIHPITGAEIWKDPRVAAWSASRAVTNAWSKMNKQTQHKFEAGRDGR